jgi:flagellar transcriptional activator FlhC
MLPFSTDWFMTWQPNVHASLFHNIYEYVNKAIAIDSVDALARAYQLYLEQIRSAGLEAVLSVTRAWRLVSFIDAGMLTTARCTRCGGRFVVHTYELTDGYVCGLCAPPSRAGKTRASRLAH